MGDAGVMTAFRSFVAAEGAISIALLGLPSLDVCQRENGDLGQMRAYRHSRPLGSSTCL